MRDADLEACRRLAAGVAREAGRLALKARLERDLDGADVRVERLIRERLRTQFSPDAVIGEELGAEGVDGAEAVWLVDPIDATANYRRGLEEWCVSIGLVAADEVQVGATYAPALGQLYTARRGHGFAIDGRAPMAGATTGSSGTLVGLGFNSGVAPETQLAVVAAVLRCGAAFRRTGSGALSLARVAAGGLDAYVEIAARPWDVAAGELLAHEAGARTLVLPAGEGPGAKRTVVAAAPEFFDALVESLQTALPSACA